MLSALRVLLFLLLATAINAQPTNRAVFLKSAQDYAAKYLDQKIDFSTRWDSLPVSDKDEYYDPPHEPVHIAALCSNLWRATGNKQYSAAAYDILASYGQYLNNYHAKASIRALYPKELPPVPHPFIFREYLLACSAIWPALEQEQKNNLIKLIRPSAIYAWNNLEWGAMNRSMIGALNVRMSVQLCGGDTLAMWKSSADQIIRDNLNTPGLEDSEKYMLIRLHAILEYLDITNREWPGKAIPAIYADYITALFSPDGSIPDFGDAWWHSNRALLLPVLEGLAAQTGDVRLKYLSQIVTINQDFLHPRSAYKAFLVSEAALWCDDNIVRESPQPSSCAAGLPVLGKKIVLRNGYDPTSTYMLINYRAASAFDAMAAANIKSSLHVEEEKMHHGHADENSTILLMSGGSVLQHDGGYRSAIPSGPLGEYRADYFHNRVVARKMKDLNQTDGKLMECIADQGKYRYCTTSMTEFTKLGRCDYSRTRVAYPEEAWQDDRCVLYLKKQNAFIIMDIVSNFGEDPLFAAGLNYTQHIDTAAPAAFITWYDTLSGKPVHGSTKLMIRYAEDDTVHTEAVMRHGGSEQLLWTALTVPGGSTAVFVKYLQVVPNNANNATYSALTFEQKGGYAICRFSMDGKICLFAARMSAPQPVTETHKRPAYGFEKDAVNLDGYRSDAAMLYLEENKDSVYCALTAGTGLMAGTKWIVKGPEMLFRYDAKEPDHLAPARLRSAERVFIKPVLH